jgi:hypothetical protein
VNITALRNSQRAALENFAAVQRVDVHIPTTGARELQLTRYTQPEPQLMLLRERLQLSVPAQPRESAKLG